MKITSAAFIKSAFDRSQWIDDGRPEIAFLGRSNVGKSSLLNSLLGRRSLARTSNTPGRTQSINYFLINNSFYFVDLPGYGYAKVSKAMRSNWGRMAEDYLSYSKTLLLSVHLVDARHEPSRLDLELYNWLVEREMASLVVTTKSDKLSRNDLLKHVGNIKQKMPGFPVVTYSSETGHGKDVMWGAIEDALKKI